MDNAIGEVSSLEHGEHGVKAMEHCESWGWVKHQLTY